MGSPSDYSFNKNGQFDPDEFNLYLHSLKTATSTDTPEVYIKDGKMIALSTSLFSSFFGPSKASEQELTPSLKALADVVKSHIDVLDSTSREVISHIFIKSTILQNKELKTSSLEILHQLLELGEPAESLIHDEETYKNYMTYLETKSGKEIVKDEEDLLPGQEKKEPIKEAKVSFPYKAVTELYALAKKFDSNHNGEKSILHFSCEETLQKTLAAFPETKKLKKSELKRFVDTTIISAKSDPITEHFTQVTDLLMALTSESKEDIHSQIRKAYSEKINNVWANAVQNEEKKNDVAPREISTGEEEKKEKDVGEAINESIPAGEIDVLAPHREQVSQQLLEVTDPVLARILLKTIFDLKKASHFTNKQIIDILTTLAATKLEKFNDLLQDPKLLKACNKLFFQYIDSKKPKDSMNSHAIRPKEILPLFYALQRVPQNTQTGLFSSQVEASHFMNKIWSDTVNAFNNQITRLDANISQVTEKFQVAKQMHLARTEGTSNTALFDTFMHEAMAKHLNSLEVDQRKHFFTQVIHFCKEIADPSLTNILFSISCEELLLKTKDKKVPKKEGITARDSANPIENTENQDLDYFEVERLKEKKQLDKVTGKKPIKKQEFTLIPRQEIFNTNFLKFLEVWKESKVLENATFLDLTTMNPLLTSKNFQELVKAMPKLQRLNMNFTPVYKTDERAVTNVDSTTKRTDEDVRALSQVCHSLREISLEGQDLVTENGILPLLEKNPQLMKFNMKDTTPSTAGGYILNSGAGLILDQLGKLPHLREFACSTSQFTEKQITTLKHKYRFGTDQPLEVTVSLSTNASALYVERLKDDESFYQRKGSKDFLSQDNSPLSFEEDL